MKIKLFAFGACALALAACGDGTQNPAALKGTNFIAASGDTNITLSFAENEMRVNGQVVNLYNASYTANGDNIEFGNIASTMMMGPVESMEVEQDYFQFLSTVEKYELKNGRLTLKNGAGREIVFQQVDEIEESETVEVFMGE